MRKFVSVDELFLELFKFGYVEGERGFLKSANNGFIRVTVTNRPDGLTGIHVSDMSKKHTYRYFKTLIWETNVDDFLSALEEYTLTSKLMLI